MRIICGPVSHGTKPFGTRQYPLSPPLTLLISSCKLIFLLVERVSSGKQLAVRGPFVYAMYCTDQFRQRRTKSLSPFSSSNLTSGRYRLIRKFRSVNPLKKSQNESSVTTDGQSASLSWCQAPIWGPRPDFYYCQTVAGLLMWDAMWGAL
jgi:hypothetical protein